MELALCNRLFFALYCKNMKVYVQQYCALGRQYLLIKSIYMMAENAAHNRRSIDENRQQEEPE